MQISPAQLAKHSFAQRLYLISGDEPLGVQDARDEIILAFQKQGFTEKERFHIEAGFHIEPLSRALNNHDLFGQKKIIDIRNSSAKFDKDMVTLLTTFMDNEAPNQVIIISTDKLSATQQKNLWFLQIKKQGCFIPIWPVNFDALPQWIIQRAKNKYHLEIPLDIAKHLAFFSEGNLLSADQALIKLNLQSIQTPVTKEQLISVLSDHARFNVFDLANAITKRDAKKALRILARLETTGEAPTLALWSITRELRTQKNYPALQKAARIDEMIKGAHNGDTWLALKELSLASCGYDI